VYSIWLGALLLLLRAAGSHDAKQGQPLHAISFMSLYIIARNVHMD
jgi:hypothetical protein